MEAVAVGVAAEMVGAVATAAEGVAEEEMAAVPAAGQLGQVGPLPVPGLNTFYFMGSTALPLVVCPTINPAGP